MSEIYINNNGEVKANNGPTLHAGNRGHLYGDGLFESLRVLNGKPLNVASHIDRMMEGAKVLKIRVPSYYTASFFEEKIQELLDLSQIKQGGRVRISLDRAIGGTYKPESNEANYFIEVYPMEHNAFTLNYKGFEVDLFMDMRKQNDILANFKTKNSLVYVMASISAQEKQLDDLLILNPKGEILEGSSSNLFVVSNGVLYTPGLEEGCLAGVMRMKIINLALSNGIKVYECNIMPQNLLAADEIFLTNAVKGITWIGGYRTKRYFNNMSKKLTDLLNKSVAELQENTEEN